MYSNKPIYIYTGMFLRSQRRLRESAEQLVTAARLSPTDSVRAASAARALRDARRCRSAERWYARAVKLNPEVSKSYHHRHNLKSFSLYSSDGKQDFEPLKTILPINV